MKTPIRNPLGDTQAMGLVEKLIPVGSVVSSLGFYSGDVELYLSNRSRFFISHTTQPALFDVWRTLFQDPTAAAQVASRTLPLKAEKDFSILQENWYKFDSPDVRAGLFYILNNCSDTGYVSKGEMDTKNYNPISLSRLRKFEKPENFELRCVDSLGDAVASTEKAAEISFLQIAKYRREFLTEGINVGVEEENIDLKQVLSLLQDKKYVILTKPSKELQRIYDGDMVYVDKYGRETKESNAEELILHNV